MIDTVVLILSQGTYRITQPDKFTPSAKWVENFKTTRGFQSKQNPTKKELLNGIYKPRLTIANRVDALRRSETVLKIELSLPKLFFGNNFNELKYKDFKNLTQKLVDVLKEMGIETTTAVISAAPISVVHYSKNIPLTDGSIPYHFINKI